MTREMTDEEIEFFFDKLGISHLKEQAKKAKK